MPDDDELIIRNSKEHDERWGWLLDSYKSCDLYDFDLERWNQMQKLIDEYIMNQQPAKWGVRKEVSIGEMIIIFLGVVPAFIVGVRDHYRIEQHDEVLQEHKMILDNHTQKIDQNITAIAVIQSRQK